jgi:hypothetical protein
MEGFYHASYEPILPDDFHYASFVFGMVWEADMLGLHGP